MSTFILNTGDGSVHMVGPADKGEVKKAKAALAPKPPPPIKLPPATPVGTKRMSLGGPDRAWPVEEEQVLEDGSKSQRYSTPKGTLILRRTCAPEERCRMRRWVWWEVEMS